VRLLAPLEDVQPVAKLLVEPHGGFDREFGFHGHDRVDSGQALGQGVALVSPARQARQCLEDFCPVKRLGHACKQSLESHLVKLAGADLDHTFA